MKSSRIALGFSFGNGMGFVAERSLQWFNSAGWTNAPLYSKKFWIRPFLLSSPSMIFAATEAAEVNNDGDNQNH
jgi:hypothetical protein